MGSGASSAVSAVHDATPEQLQEAFANLSPEDQERLKKQLEAVSAPADEKATAAKEEAAPVTNEGAAPAAAETAAPEAAAEAAAPAAAEASAPAASESTAPEVAAEAAAPAATEECAAAATHTAPKEEATPRGYSASKGVPAPTEDAAATPESVAAPAAEAPAAEEDEFTKKLRMAFKEIDTDNSGAIEVKELGAILKKMGNELPEDRVQKVFDSADLDGNKKLDFDEYKKLVAKAVEQASS